jgi:electron transfer flavoprotein beta subunit
MKKIIVCVKQVPASSAVATDPETGNLIRSSAGTKLNPYDLFGIEAALTLKASVGANVTALCMGPAQAVESLKEVLYMGADEGVLISDRRFAGADVLATAYTLAGAISKIGDYDLILCGKQTTDGDTAQVGAEIAELLGIPHLFNVTNLEYKEGSLLVDSSLTDSVVRFESPLPCLVSVSDNINVPRLPSYKRLKEIEHDDTRILKYNLGSLFDKDSAHYGSSGSATQVQKVYTPDRNVTKTLYEGSPNELSGILYDKLVEGKFL